MSLLIRWRSLPWGDLAIAILVSTIGCTAAIGQTGSSASTLEQADVEKKLAELPALGDEWKPLGSENGKNRVWIHQQKKQVAIDGEVCLTRGYLEMFACVENTKEHESVVALKSKAFVIHAALLAVGAKPGAPANWRPSYTPARGPTVETFVQWMEKGEPKRVKAQEWIRDLKTQKAMTYEWVFGGSSVWKDPETAKSYYRAEGGDLICVSNFPTAMMDLPIESSQANDELAFEAFTEHIPQRHTPIRLYLVPKFEENLEARKNLTP